MPPVQKPNKAVLAARARRKNAGAQNAENIEWFIEEVSNKIAMTLEQRMRIAVEYLRTKVVKNISRPVTIKIGPKGGKIVTDRSKPGEFPKAETTMLMKTVFQDVKTHQDGSVSGYVGTPLDYGLTLETEMDRSFLIRTLNEERGTVTRLLTGPIK